MSKEDDLTLQIGFAPDLASLKKAAEEGAKAYSDKFTQQLSARLKLPKGYTSSFEPGHHLHNAQKLAEDDFIRDSDVQRVTREFKEAALSMIKGLTKGVKDIHNFNRGVIIGKPYSKEGTLVGQPYGPEYGDVKSEWRRQHTLLIPEKSSFDPDEYLPEISEISDDLNANAAIWQQAFRETKAEHHKINRLRMQDIANAARIHKHFNMPDSAYYSSQKLSAANFGEEDPAYRLHATQFIKNEEYRRKFVDILNAYGKPEGFFEVPAASTWKYHPLFAHGKGGLVRHTEAVMQGVFQDAVAAGFSPEDTDKLMFASGLHDAMKYQGGRPNARHAQDMAFVLSQLGYKDEADWVKTHMGEVKSGYGKGAGPAEGNMYQKIIADTDFLVSRQYAQDFVDWRNGSMTPDMQKLREEAVRRGEGRWIDENKPHTFENWERIVKDSKDVKDNTKGIIENLRDIAGLLAVIHGINKAIKAVKRFDSNAEKDIQQTATALPNRRYYAGFSEFEALRNQSAAAAAGLGREAVNTDVINFSARRGEMSLYGKGFDLLPVSVLGQWQNMMKEGDANTAWWNTLSAVAGRYAGASQKEREQLQKLLDDTLGKSATELLAFSRNTGIPLEQLRALRENPNYPAVSGTEGMSYDLSKLNESIHASYLKMYEDWMKSFGLPFRDFWDRLLIDLTNNPLYKLVTGNGGNSVEAMTGTAAEFVSPIPGIVDFFAGKYHRAKKAADVFESRPSYSVALKVRGDKKQLNKELDTLSESRPFDNMTNDLNDMATSDRYLYNQTVLKLQEYGLDAPVYREAVSSLGDWSTSFADKEDIVGRNMSDVLFTTLAKNKNKSFEEQQTAINDALTEYLGNVKYWDIVNNPNLSKTDKMEFTTGTLKIDITHDYTKDTSENIRANGKVVGPGWNNTVELPVKLQALPTGK